MENNPKTINNMQKEASSKNLDGKFVIIPKSLKKVKKSNGKTIMLPTDMEVKTLKK